jgi:hypothetical protein
MLYIFIIHFKLYVVQVESLCKVFMILMLHREIVVLIPTATGLSVVPEDIHIPTIPPGVPEHIHIHNRDPNDAGGDTARIQMILLAYSYSPPNRSVPKLDPSANQYISNN